MSNQFPRSILRLAVLCAAAAIGLPAASFSFNGTFGQDDDLALFTFHLDSPATVTLITYGYAGGVNSAAQIVPGGGFDPYISVFQGIGPTAALFNVNNDGGCGNVGADISTGACWDSYLSLAALPGGDYTVVLSQADNTPGSLLGDLFSRAGQGNFTGPAYLGSEGSFIDANPAQRTAAWALDILSVTSATGPGSDVPEPASVALLGAGLLALAAFQSRRS